MEEETPISELEWNQEGTEYVYTCYVCNGTFKGGSMEEVLKAHDETDCDEKAFIDIFEGAKRRLFTMAVEK